MVEKIRARIGSAEDILNPKAAALTFAVLIACLVGWSLGIVFLGDSAEKPHPTGKVMATVFLPKVEAPSPENYAPRVEDTPEDSPPNPDAPLTEGDGGSTEHATTTGTGAHPLSEPPPPAVEESVAGLTESSGYGDLPVIRKEDKLRPYDAYKTPFKPAAKTKGVIALVMTDYGLSDKVTNEALADLPAGVTVVAVPYAQNLQAKITTARERGQEVWMTLPLQAPDFAANDTGPSTILSGIADKQNIARLNTTLGRATGYVGVVSIGETIFKETSPETQAVFKAVTERGLGAAFIDGGDKDLLKPLEEKPVSLALSRHLTVGAGGDSLDAQLKALEATATEKGYVTAVFPASSPVIKAIAAWAKTLSGKGVQLSPLSYAIYQSSISTGQ